MNLSVPGAVVGAGDALDHRHDPIGSSRGGFYSAAKKAGLKHLRFHDLRHTFATRLVQAGVDIYTVQKLGRWKNISMVMRYAHHHPESLRSGVEVLDRIGRSI
ncbi:MAG: tyrosine-type recombinase/integrase [Pseudomonadota bacterium]